MAEYIVCSNCYRPADDGHDIQCPRWTGSNPMSAGENDQVVHPSYYNQGKIEVLEFLEDQKLPGHEWNVVKYLCRARFKGNELQDLKKAKFYLDRKIEILEDKAGRPNDLYKKTKSER